tara:strand:- start:74242 stop:75294 length:1053 start_codon:yes stop_codon:yes gene_type:complete
MLFFLGLVTCLAGTGTAADDSLERQASWTMHDASAMSSMLRSALDDLGIVPHQIDQAAEQFLTFIERDDVDPLDAFMEVIQPIEPTLGEVSMTVAKDPAAAAAKVDPNTAGYAAIESLPKVMRMSARVWLGRELVRQRLYDEALPVIAEVDPAETIDPASALFFRGACYHALMMKKDALADLRMLLENEDKCPDRYTRTAKMMIADIKPLKEDTLDEISRLMTDVTRRLDLGRADDDVAQREQKIIDKLTKLIDKIEKQQQQQQQQQQQSSGGQGQSGQPDGPGMQDSRIAGANGNGDVDNQNIEKQPGWGNLPPAERKEALQQISRDLPTHYREAIEAYFRKLATDGDR